MAPSPISVIWRRSPPRSATWTRWCTWPRTSRAPTTAARGRRCSATTSWAPTTSSRRPAAGASSGRSGGAAVGHRAATAQSPDTRGEWEPVLRDNVVGTYNVFEAARRAGVKRVIYASSGATVSSIERDAPYAALAAGRYDEVAEWPGLHHESGTRPEGLYGCSKIWGE